MILISIFNYLRLGFDFYMNIYFIALLILLSGGLLSIPVKETWKLKVCSLSTMLSGILFFYLSLNSLFTGSVYYKNFYVSPIFGQVNFVIDQLSAFFLLVISAMSFIGVLYANGYIKPYFNKNANTSSHSFFLMMLIASMSCIVTVQNSMFFLLIWELMSLSSFFLVIFEGEKKEVLRSGIKYLVYMHISVLFIISAFVLLNIKSGSFNFSDFPSILSDNKHLSNIVFILAFIGFGTKAGFFPFHNWLPDAHPAAPSHVSGIMSGVMIKTGIYGILRTLLLIGMPTKFIAYTVLVVAIISAIWGVLYAITQHDIKRLLAYHSLENIGIIGIGIGVGLLGMFYHNPLVSILGMSGGILHILNHSIFKILLFFAAGSVYNKTHTRDIELLGGLIKKMPYTALLFIIGSVAICALPPFNGFISEFLIYAGMIAGLQSKLNITLFITFVISLAALALIGTMAILCFTKVVGVMFLGNPRSSAAANVNCDVEKIMIIPMSILAILTLLIGFFPQYAILTVLSPVFEIIKIDSPIQSFSSVVQLLSIINFIFFIFLGLFILVLIIRILLNKKYSIHSTWGCGYNKPNERMQYTASSYADLFISTMQPMFKSITHIKTPDELFPKDAYYEVEIEDIEEAYVVKPLINLDEKFLSKFEKIQNGNMQQYILFGLIFLLLAIVGLLYWG